MHLKLVGEGRREAREAVAALGAAGLVASLNGSGIQVETLPNQRALPIRVLERAGIVVVDFSVEDGAADVAAEEDTWIS